MTAHLGVNLEDFIAKGGDYRFTHRPIVKCWDVHSKPIAQCDRIVFAAMSRSGAKEIGARVETCIGGVMADQPRALIGASGTHNEVRLIGRLGSTTEQRQLPSGDVIAVFSVVVDRPVREQWGRTKVDTIACQAMRPVIIARLALVDPGQWVKVEGVLRRRFWRGGSGLASSMEVEVRQLARIKAEQ